MFPLKYPIIVESLLLNATQVTRIYRGTLYLIKPITMKVMVIDIHSKSNIYTHTYYLDLCFWNKDSCSPGWPWVSWATEDDLDPSASAFQHKLLAWATLPCLCCYIEIRIHIDWAALVFLFSWTWPWTPDLPASASQVLRFQVNTTNPSYV